MYWFRAQVFVGDIHRDFYLTHYKEKVLNIDVLHESENQVRVRAAIIVPNKEERKKELEYYYGRVFVGIGEEFSKKIDNLVKFKISELETIATEQDAEIFSQN